MRERDNLPATILVIFGITGDLSRRYLLPGLSQIAEAGRLPKEFKIVGISRREVTIDEVMDRAGGRLQKNLELFRVDVTKRADYQALKKKLELLGENFSAQPQIIFYPVVPPSAVLPIVKSLGEVGLNAPHVKLLLEKPFGVDLASAQEFIAQTAKYFSESNVYRIDHYLAKEVAQNIVVFLGSNTLFRDVWDHRFIEKIEIIGAESIGIEGRAAFYESTGALRDFMQSHLMQLAALTLMEPCTGVFEFEEVPQRRLAALKTLNPVDPNSAIRAQYSGYRQEVNSPSSIVETFMALTLTSHDSRWQGVPIRLITGKNLDQKLTEIRIYFKKSHDSQTNRLILRIQPKEGIELDLWVKEPGYEQKLQKLPLSFSYDQHFDRLPDAYEQVLVDAMRSAHSLFASSDEVLASWELLEPIQKHWAKSAQDLFLYKPGSTISEVLEQTNR